MNGYIKPQFRYTKSMVGLTLPPVERKFDNQVTHSDLLHLEEVTCSYCSGTGCITMLYISNDKKKFDYDNKVECKVCSGLGKVITETEHLPKFKK